MHKTNSRWKKSIESNRRAEERGRHRYRSPPRAPISPPPPSRHRHRDVTTSYERDRKRGYTTLLISNIGNKEYPNDVKESLEYEFLKYGDVKIKVTNDRNGDQIAYARFRSPTGARNCKSARGFLLLKDRRLHIEAIYNDEFTDYSRRSITPPQRSRSPIYPRHRKPPMRSDVTSRGRSGSFEPSERRYEHSDRKYNRHSPIGRSYQPRGISRDYTPPPRSKHREVDYMPSRSRSISREVSPEKDLPQNFAPVDAGTLAEPEFFPPEDHPSATRTLFIGNLDQSLTPSDIRRKFEPFGHIESIDMKKSQRNNGASSYCFIQYGNLDMAYRAKLSMNGQLINNQTITIGYGKVIPSVRVWVGGLGAWTKLGDLEQEFDRFGAIKRIDYHRGETCAAILYETIDAAKEACSQMRGFLMPNAETRLRMDFLDLQSDASSYRDIPDHRRRSERRNEGYRRNTRGRNRPYYRSESAYDKRGFKDDKYPSPSQTEASPKNSSQSGPPKKVVNLNPAKAEMQFKHEHAKTCYGMNDLCHCFAPPCWQGGFVLKNIHFPVHFYLLDGDMAVFNTTTADPTSPTGRRIRFNLSHRLHLTDQRIEVIRRRLERPVCKQRSCLIVAVPGFPNDLYSANGGNEQNENITHKPLRGLVKYFKEKNCAAIVKLSQLCRAANKDEDESSEKKLSGVMHAFPPSPFVTEQLLKIGPQLQPQFFLDDYLLLFLVKGPKSIVV